MPVRIRHAASLRFPRAMFVSSGLVGPKTRLKSVVEAGHQVNIPEPRCTCYQQRSDAEGQTILRLVVEVQAGRGFAQVKSVRALTSRGDVDLGSARRSGFHHAAKKNSVVNVQSVRTVIRHRWAS